MHYALVLSLLFKISNTTAARSTIPFTTFCQFASMPIKDIPRLITPIKVAPTTIPNTEPEPPYADTPPTTQAEIASVCKQKA